MKRLNEIAKRLDQAAFTAQAVNQVSEDTDFNLDEAYAIQALSIDERLRRGENLTGYKLGFTSKAKMEQMGVHEIIWGRLTDQMHLEVDGELDLSQFIHPRVEPELAFRVSKDITSRVSLEHIEQYFDKVAGALEVIDSRYKNFKFSLEDVVADNCSSAAYVVGEWQDLNIDLSALKMRMNINDEMVQEGDSSAILGHPLNALVALTEMIEKYDFEVKAGQVIFAGAATSAVYLNSGDKIKAVIENLGELEFSVK